MWNIMGTHRIHCDFMGFFMGVPLKSWGIPSRHRDLKRVFRRDMAYGTNDW